MSNILIVLDQPSYQENARIASSSTTVRAIFAGDIAEGRFRDMRDLRGMLFDTVMVPVTLEEGSAVHKKVMSFISSLDFGKTNVITYNNFY